MHYYQFNIGDYRRDTAHLSRLEHGIYRDLIDWYYLEESPIPLETQSVMRRLRLASQEEAQALKNVLSDFFTEADGWRHHRIDEDIRNYHAMAEKNKTNGKLGGRPKKTQSVPSGNPNETQSKGNQEPITNNQEPVESKATRAARFDFFKSLTDEGVPDQAAKDYIATRKAKRCAQTETAFKQFIVEVRRSGLSTAEIVAICCKKSWGGFESSWLDRDRLPQARGSPLPTTGRQSRIDNYAAQAAAARGGNENEYGTGRTERDITSEAVRVA